MVCSISVLHMERDGGVVGFPALCRLDEFKSPAREKLHSPAFALLSEIAQALYFKPSEKIFGFWWLVSGCRLWSRCFRLPVGLMVLMAPKGGRYALLWFHPS